MYIFYQAISDQLLSLDWFFLTLLNEGLDYFQSYEYQNHSIFVFTKIVDDALS